MLLAQGAEQLAAAFNASEDAGQYGIFTLTTPAAAYFLTRSGFAFADTSRVHARVVTRVCLFATSGTGITSGGGAAS